MNLTLAPPPGHLSRYACRRSADSTTVFSFSSLHSVPQPSLLRTLSTEYLIPAHPLSFWVVRLYTRLPVLLGTLFPSSHVTKFCCSPFCELCAQKFLQLLDKEILYIMSTRALRGAAVRSYRRRKTALDLDLNQAPPGESRELEGPSTELEPQGVQAILQPQVGQPAMIDVEAIDDDIVESTPRAFAEAKNNSRRNRSRDIVDVDLEDRTRVTKNNRNKRRRDYPSQTIINCDLYINLEGSSSSMKENVRKSPEPPEEPVFNCPICMGPLVEEMSTRCGHIFCKSCIKAAINAQGKCPTCRKKVTAKELIRVFLPSTS